MKKTLYNALLKVRNNQMLCRICLEALIRHNLQEGEIVSYEFVDTHPAIVLKDGTRLVAFKGQTLPINKKWGVPETHTGLLASYFLRYKYPHCMPGEKINTGIWPRRLFPALIHRQHMNTIWELPKPEQKKFAQKLAILPGDRILEIGPFIGFGTLRMSGLVGEKGRVVSVEADTRAYELLNLNIEKNGLQNTFCLNYAVATQDAEQVEFYLGKDQANSIINGMAPKTRRTRLLGRTITSVIEEAGFEPNFLILTINGTELQALMSCSDFLSTTQSLRIITPGWYSDGHGKTGRRIVNYLISLGFEVNYTPGMHIFAYK